MYTCLLLNFTTSPMWSHSETVKHFVICADACLDENRTRSPVRTELSRSRTSTRERRREAAHPISPRVPQRLPRLAASNQIFFLPAVPDGQDRVADRPRHFLF